MTTLIKDRRNKITKQLVKIIYRLYIFAFLFFLAFLASCKFPLETTHKDSLAIKNLEKQAMNGNARAKFAYGKKICCDDAKNNKKIGKHTGGQRSLKQSLNFICDAAKLGNANAMEFLGDVYQQDRLIVLPEDGENFKEYLATNPQTLPTDNLLAFVWYNLASVSLGKPRVKRNKLLENLSIEDVRLAKDLIIKYPSIECGAVMGSEVVAKPIMKTEDIEPINQIISEKSKFLNEIDYKSVLRLKKL